VSAPTADPPPTGLYPLFLKLDSRPVLVVGAGEIAERKVASLIAAGARVLLVAPMATDGLRRLAEEGSVEWRRRAFEDDDAEGAWLVIAATNDAEVQRQASAAAEARRVFVIAVDDPVHASAYSGAVITRPPLIVSISSSGEAPALIRLMREIIEEILPADEWIEHARRLRAKWRAERTPMGNRFAELVKAFRDRAP
jgi:uroporphyrin-III C-methyltransferase / precorrin-2 dehydrogenase / sirohydrochlorin ferrochelatase